MDEGKARDLAGRWRALHGGVSDLPYYEHLVHALGGLLPDDLAAAAAVSGEDGPMIVALGARRLFAAMPREAAGDTGVELQVASLEVARTQVAVTEHFVEAPGLTRRRRWSFSAPAAEIVFTTEQTLRTAFSFERQAGKDELLARAVAGTLGWPVPFSEEDR
jgi:hypothetical protein